MRSTHKWILLLIFLSVFVNSCGSDGGGSAQGVSNNSYAMVVSSEADLPPCGEANEKQLVYVSSVTGFKSCSEGSWVAISINGKDGEDGEDGTSGEDGEDGISILSNQLLNPYNTNICTSFPAIESCFFNGGQIVKLSDNSIIIMGNYSFQLYISAASNGGNAEYDRFSNSITLIAPPSSDVVFQRLDWEVSRGVTYLRALYLVYTRSTDLIQIVFDTDDDGVPEITDSVVHTVVRSNW
jgi:hypothetical protein